MARTVLAIAMAAMLAGCTHSAARITCPPLKEYSTRTQQRIAADIRAIRGKHPALETFIVDSTKLRDAVRTCHAARGGQRR